MSPDDGLGARPNEAPMPGLPTRQWVPPQRLFDPSTGRDI
jgi:hypothetical protein